MALFDLPLDQLRNYRPDPDEPEDFDAFWQLTLDEAAAHPLDAEFAPYDGALAAVDSYDVSFDKLGRAPDTCLAERSRGRRGPPADRRALPRLQRRARAAPRPPGVALGQAGPR